MGEVMSRFGLLVPRHGRLESMIDRVLAVILHRACCLSANVSPILQLNMKILTHPESRCVFSITLKPVRNVRDNDTRVT